MRSLVRTGAAGIVGLYLYSSINQNRVLAEKNESRPIAIITKSDRKKVFQNFDAAIAKSKKLCAMKMHEDGLPGLFICVHVDGKLVWKDGFGFADFENSVEAHPDSVLRIASISKSLTSMLVGKLMQEGKIKLDDKVSDYLPDYPHSDITVKQLLSHTSGIRHYKKKNKEESKNGEFDNAEYYLKEKFGSVMDSIKLFRDDDLFHKPGEEFLYSTHGYTLLSAVLESAEKKFVNERNPEKAKKVRFEKMMTMLFKDLGLENTYLDENDPIIMNRARFYVRDKSHQLKNAPYVDNSYKWAGGGFLSTVKDLCKFGDIALYCYQSEDGYLRRNIFKQLWSGIVRTNPDRSLNEYGLGWLVSPESEIGKLCRQNPFSIWHSGGAIGASSLLLVSPPSNYKVVSSAPKGVVVAIITNLQDVGLLNLAKDIASEFKKSNIEDSAL